MEELAKKAGFIHKDWDTILKNKKIDIVMNNEQIVAVLKKIGHSIDEDGYIISSRNEKRVLSNDGNEIKLNELGAVIPGTKNFIKNNIASFSQFLAEHEQ